MITHKHATKQAKDNRIIGIWNDFAKEYECQLQVCTWLRRTFHPARLVQCKSSWRWNAADWWSRYIDRWCSSGDRVSECTSDRHCSDGCEVAGNVDNPGTIAISVRIRPSSDAAQCYSCCYHQQQVQNRQQSALRHYCPTAMLWLKDASELAFHGLVCI